MRSYAAARTYFSILEFVSWCIIVLGAIVALVAIAAFGQMSRSFGGSSMAGLAGLIPGASVVFAGFMGLVVAQIGRAGVDSAEYGQQMLKIARDQLEVSQQGLRGDAKVETGFAALNREASEDTTVSPIAAPQASYDTAASGDTQIEAEPDDVIDDRGGNDSDVAKIEPQRSIPQDKSITYNGQKIEHDAGAYLVDGVSFATLNDAKTYITQNARPFSERR